MTRARSTSASGHSGRKGHWLLLLGVLLCQMLPARSSAAFPKRLILAVDGIAYCDMKALQQGVTFTDAKGRQVHRQAFNHGYYPASRMISTFPSTSDVAWTEIFGDRPLPGYQRTYYSGAANSQIAINGVTTSMEHERQMQYELHNGLLRFMGYVFPRLTFKYDTHELMKRIAEVKEGTENFYAYIRTTDDAQHLSADILVMLCALDAQLEDLRARCRAQEGRDLEILLLSDHGNNKAGPPKRVPVRKFLEQNGYRITRSLQQPRDVVLPTAGIESWVEIHNAPEDTLELAQRLAHTEGVDVLTARMPGEDDRFLVLNPKDERAAIEWNAAKDSYRYVMESGDPLGYAPVIGRLASKGQLDPAGFATSDAWMAETLTNHYPLALERIVRGHTHVTLNPATILISLDNHYAHAAWLILKGSERVKFGGTHGALDDINSTGMILSNFAPTQDTCTCRVAALYGGFAGLREYRAQENGAEWITWQGQTLTRVARSPVDSGCCRLSSDKVYLRVWGPALAQAGSGAQLDLVISYVPRYSCAEVRRGDAQPRGGAAQHLTLTTPIEFGDRSRCERVYELPADVVFEPRKQYRITGRLKLPTVDPQIFDFAFRTDSRAQPIAY